MPGIILSYTVINDTEERKKKAVRFSLQKSPIKVHQGIKDIKSSGCGHENERCAVGQLVAYGPIQLGKKSKPTVLGMHGPDSSGALAVAGGGGRDHKSTLKQARPLS